MSCRFNPGGLFRISNDIMDNPGDSKYGMTEEQLTEAFRILKDKGVKHFGIHAFLASNTVTNEYYPLLAKILFEMAVRVKNAAGVHIAFINLSGGIGIPYRPDQEPNDIRVIGDGVRKVYEEVLVPAGMGDVAIFTELGRFMLGPYGALVTRAIHEKHTYKEYIGVDACAVNLMRPAMYGAYHHITVMGKENAPCDHKYDVTGSLCENNDKFAVDRMLPEIQMGDLLFIHDTGAHGFSMGYNYNGKLRSAELLLQEDGSVHMIRRAETPKDYFATFDFCGLLKDVE
jgi:diaminopimelate decarboxylase